MKKKLLILFIPFLLTGCASVNYKLDINKDFNVTEKVNISATSSYFSNFYRNFPITIVKEFYNDADIQKKLNDNNYSHYINEKNVKYPEVVVSKTYSSLNEYKDSTIFVNQVFKSIKIITTDDLMTINITDFIPYVIDTDSDTYPVSKLEVAVKLPFVATSNNADKYDAKTNTYKWSIDSSTKEKSIEITFDKNKVYVYNIVMYISIFILVLIILIIIILALKMQNKNRINNNFR